MLLMAPRHQLLVTGGRKGWISVLELPHRLQRQSFQAHDSPVKALAVDPTEDVFISGSAEGNIKVGGPDLCRTTRPVPGSDRSCDSYAELKTRSESASYYFVVLTCPIRMRPPPRRGSCFRIRTVVCRSESDCLTNTDRDLITSDQTQQLLRADRQQSEGRGVGGLSSSSWAPPTNSVRE